MSDLISKVREKLDQAGVAYEFIPLPDDLPADVQSHMKFHGRELKYAMPNMVFKTEKGLIVAQRRADTQIDSKKLKKLLGVQRLSLADEKELESLGLKPGIVPPFGYDAPIFIDKKVLENSEIYTGTGDKLFTLKINPNDLIKMNNATVGDFTTNSPSVTGLKRILTGDRPTSDSFHLGNYIGSLKNRVKLQDEYDTYILLADLHALTTHFDKTEDLEKNIKGLMLGYLSVGLDPEKVTFCLQSQINGTTELAYILSILTQRAVLERQPALKEKLDQGNQDTLGLYYYPVLMAADILLPKANLVPVGKDQKAHVEFTRDIAIKFNNLYGEVFPIPESLIGEVPTLPGVDGQAKMGKSLGNAIFLTDSAQEVEKKVMSMYTDPKRIHATDPGEVEGNPVFIYLDAFGTEDDKLQTANYKLLYSKGQVGDIEVKKYLVKVLNNFLDPIRKRRVEYEEQPDLVDKILKEGTAKARLEAQKTLEEVRKAMKLDYF